MKTQARKQTKSPTTQQSCLTNLTMPGAKVLTILKGSGHGSIVGVGSFGMALGGWVWWKLTFRPTLCCAQGELGHESLGTKSAGFSCVGISLLFSGPRRDVTVWQEEVMTAPAMLNEGFEVDWFCVEGIFGDSFTSDLFVSESRAISIIGEITYLSYRGCSCSWCFTSNVCSISRLSRIVNIVLTSCLKGFAKARMVGC